MRGSCGLPELEVSHSKSNASQSTLLAARIAALRRGRRLVAAEDAVSAGKRHARGKIVDVFDGLNTDDRPLYSGPARRGRK